MLIGYMRVSKADGSQATDLQCDTLVAAGVDPAHLYEDQASGVTSGIKLTPISGMKLTHLM